MDGNQRVFDDAVRYAVFIERFKTGAVNRLRDFLIELDRDQTAVLEGILARMSADDRRNFLRGRGTRTQQLQRLIDELQTMRVASEQVLLDRVTEEVTPIAEMIAARNAASAAVIGVTASVPRVSQLERLVRLEPFQGNVLSEWARDWSDARVRRATQQIRIGLGLGERTDQIARRLIGTSAANNTDGILAVSRRGAETIVRTSANHARTVGDVEFARANRDQVRALLRRAVLDTRTSDICRINDGREYTPEEADGVLPAHPNCRSIFTVLWNRQGRPEDDDYFDWLNRQNRDVQEEALGPTRARLFRQGGLQGRDLIRASTGQPYTLDELRRREAEAFERAGLDE